jgi:tetratricopeptide (TPR) repeat protein
MAGKKIETQKAKKINKHIVGIVFIVLCIFAAYVNSLNGTWAMDDIVVNKNISIKDIYDLVGFRKIAYLTFYLNQLISSFDPANYRLVNIVIHIMNSLLVYLLAYKTIMLIFKNRPGYIIDEHKKVGNDVYKEKAFYVALLSSIIFALHPINTNAVTYIVQRMASLATFFVLLSLLFYIFSIESNSRLRAITFYFLSGVSIVAGIFSKENTLLAIPLIMLYDFIILSRNNKSGFYKRVFVISVIGITSITISFYLLQLHQAFIEIIRGFVNFNEPILQKGWTATDVYWTPLQHILTEFRVVVKYLLLIIFPNPNLMVFDWWSYPLSKGLFEPISTILSMGLIFLMISASIILRKKLPLFSFAILWYLIGISLESFIALGSDLYFEHRNYLPISGLIIGLVGQATLLFNRNIKIKFFLVTLILVALILGSLTIVRNSVWKDSITLWTDTIKKDPSNIRAIMALGNTYFNINDLNNAEKYYLRAIKLSSENKRATFLDNSVYSIGFIYLYTKRFEEAKELIEKYEGLLESHRPNILKGFYKALNNDSIGAIEEYKKAISEAKGIDRLVVLTLLGDVYRGLGEYSQAIENYEKVINFDPSFSAALYGTGLSYIGLRDLDSAEEYLIKAITADPYNVLAYADLSDLVILKRKDISSALRYAQKAVSYETPFYQPYLSMGSVLLISGKEKEAEHYYKIALSKGAKDYVIFFSKARAYFIKGDKEKAAQYLSILRNYKNLPEDIKSLINR